MNSNSKSDLLTRNTQGKRKTGIVSTVYGTNNYGGMLQGYALVKACQKLGFDAEQISIDMFRSNPRTVTQNSFSELLHQKWNGFTERLGRLIFYKFLQGNKRHAAFDSFFQNYIQHTEKIYSYTDIKETNELFDVFLCGSDVIWQQNESGVIKELYYLSFVDNDKRRVSYAPSFGKPSIPPENIERTKELLSRFDHLSIREETGKELLKQFGFDAQVVADPTMLIKKDEWEQLCRNGQHYEKEGKYAFAYLLSDISENKKAIASYCKRRNITLITVPYGTNKFCFDDLNFGNRQEIAADPITWLNLIRNADIVFTDSFHGIIFSTLFNVNYWAFRRDTESDEKSLNTRIENIVTLFGTKDRYIYAGDLCQKVTETISWDAINRKFEQVASESKEYLLNALTH